MFLAKTRQEPSLSRICVPSWNNGFRLYKRLQQNLSPRWPNRYSHTERTPALSESACFIRISLLPTAWSSGRMEHVPSLKMLGMVAPPGKTVNIQRWTIAANVHGTERRNRKRDTWNHSRPKSYQSSSPWEYWTHLWKTISRNQDVVVMKGH